MCYGCWGVWFKWSLCLKVCGGGMKIRYCFCDSLVLVYGGRDCGRKRIGKFFCNIDNCLGSVL